MNKKGSILIIENDAIFLKLLEDTLTSEGYEVFKQENSSLISSGDIEPPDIALIEIDMPDINGFDIFRRLKAIDGWQDVAVIFISADYKKNYRIEGAKLDAVDYITKSVDTNDLLIRIHTHIKLQQTKKILEIKTINLSAINKQLKNKILEHKNTEELLVEKTVEWQTTFDAIEYPVFLISKDFKVITMNRAGLEMTGIKDIESHEVYLNKILSIPYEKCPCVKSFSSKKPETSEYEIRGKTFKVNCWPILNQANDITSFTVIYKDISEEKKIEEMVISYQRLDSIGNISAGIAHYFNNVLTGILGFISIIKHKESDPQTLSVINSIIKSTETASDLTHKLLTFGRAGKEVIKSFNVNKIITDTVTILNYTSNKSIIYKTDLAEDLYMTEGDPAQINQVILNICMNAIEAVYNDGTISITTKNFTSDYGFAKKHHVQKDKPYIYISISDNGCGMDAALLKRIFEPFFSTKTGDNRTAGLGLSVVYGIIKNHNGLIEIISNPGMGTTFKLYLPKGEKNEIKDNTEIMEIKKGSGNILIVDDETVVLTIAKTMLEILGFSSITAKNGKDAIDIFTIKHKEIDAVILDLKLGDINGKDILRILKEIKPSIPVIISSGYADSDIKDLLKLPHVSTCSKPYTIKQLGDSISLVLGKS